MKAIVGLRYSGSGDAAQLSFKYVSHENVAIGVAANTSLPIQTEEIILSLLVGAHVEIGTGTATTASMVLPAGLWPLVVAKEDAISLLQLTGGQAGQASIIVPETKSS